MKIIISVDALSNAMTGIGRYTWELMQGLKRSPEVHELLFFSRTRFVQEPDPFRDSGNSVRPRRNFLRKALRFGYRLIGPVLQRVNFSRRADFLYHGTNFYLPKFPGKKVVTIHDLSVLRFPEYHPADRVAHLGTEIPRAIQVADLILTDSDFIKKEIIERFPAASGKVIAIPLACGSEFRPHTPSETSLVLGKYGLKHGAYSLYVGTIEPRKNVLGILEAYRLLPDSLKRTFPLVISGHPGWHSKDIHDAMDKAVSEGWCNYLGYLEASDLPTLYGGASCFLFPSIYEGFGLPVLEAMASGVPVVTSPKSSMEEIASDSALYANPDDIAGISQSIQSLLVDTELRESMSRKALERSGCFSWEKTVSSTINAYKDILS